MFILLPQSVPGLNAYFFDRAIPRISNGVETKNGIHILILLFQQLLAPLSATILAFMISKRKSIPKHAVFFLLVGLSGSIPIIISQVQKQFYLVPALPFFALGFSYILISLFESWLETGKNNLRIINTFKVLSLVVIAITLMLLFENTGKASRDRELLFEVEILNQYLPDQTNIYATTTVYYNWNMHSYLIRNAEIYPDYKNTHEYMLIDKRYDKAPNESYVRVSTGLQIFDLYKKPE
jgi:hypothetical protein